MNLTKTSTTRYRKLITHRETAYIEGEESSSLVFWEQVDKLLYIAAIYVKLVL